MKRSSRAGRLTQLERNQRTTGIFFILPSLVLCAIFMVVPLINVIRYSLTDWDGLSKTYNFVGLYNYMHLHEIEGFGEMMLATVTFAIGVTAITIIVSFLAALALDKRGRDRLPRGLMRALWFFPALLSGAVCLVLALALAAVLYSAVFGFTDTFVALFNSESSALMAEYAHSGMRIYFLGYFFAGCNIVAAGYLGAVNRPTEATITSVSRGVAAIVTCCIHADLLVLLSDIDGLYTANPHTHPEARLLPLVERITPEILALADGVGSSLGTGGMSTKLRAAQLVTELGADMVITNGSHPELLYDIAEGRPVGTRFAGRKEG